MSVNHNTPVPKSPAYDFAPEGDTLATHSLELITFSPTDQEARQRFARLPNAISYGPHGFPALEQYHDAVMALKAASNALDDSGLMVLAQRSWHIKGQNGCNFARVAAAHAEGLPGITQSLSRRLVSLTGAGVLD